MGFHCADSQKPHRWLLKKSSLSYGSIRLDKFGSLLKTRHINIFFRLAGFTDDYQFTKILENHVFFSVVITFFFHQNLCKFTGKNKISQFSENLQASVKPNGREIVILR